MKTNVIEVRDMLSVLGPIGVAQRIGGMPGVKSVKVNHAKGCATVSYDETRFDAAYITGSDAIERFNTGQGERRVCDLPNALRTAQQAIYLPEVQSMLRRLAEYGLGIFMPHIHGEQTDKFRPLPDSVIQVEAGLEVSFRPAEEVAYRNRFLPVGWFWRAGQPAPVAVCELRFDQ